MAVNYSVGRKGMEAFEAEVRPGLDELKHVRQLLVKMMVEDQSAYAELTAARKLPENDPMRPERIRTSLAASIRAPQQVAAAAVKILEVCDRVLNFLNPHLLSDLAVSADLAMATARCGLYNVRVNLPAVTDPAERQQIEATSGQLLSRAAALIQRVAPRIWERMQQAK
jgi:formiminotetrahydrofolate cyclodeaminase